ncbi:MAG: hypothetical protein D3916_06505 [Candidatus Electrothrix sp. MAN1_4]|nr:hypothetical protein [Candidatus Electrothrix sp. MAN1_4]
MNSAGQIKKTFGSTLPIEVTAQHAGTGRVMAGPLGGRLFDLTKNKACLLMSQIKDDTYHLFYSTQEDTLLFLNIFFDLTSPFDEHCKVTALPLWFNIFQQEQVRSFIMGIEFTRNSEEKTVRKFLARKVQRQSRM